MQIDLSMGLRRQDLKRPVREYMIPAETAFSVETKVQELLDTLEVMEIRKELRHFYLVDEDNRLQGIVSTRAILFSKRTEPLGAIGEKGVIKVLESDLLEDALRIMSEYELLSLPVVDVGNRLVGVIEIIPQHLTQSLISAREENRAARELFQLLGFIPEEMKLNSPLNEYRYRMPWLLCNVVGGLTCAIIGSHYKVVLGEVVALAMFIPLVLTLGEAVAVQSMTLSLQFLHATRPSFQRCINRLITESKVSTMLALTCILFTGALLWFWGHKWMLFGILSASIFGSLLLAASFGTLFPLILRRLSFDPKVAGGPVVLMLTDIMVTSLYLSIANYLLIP